MQIFFSTVNSCKCKAEVKNALTKCFGKDQPKNAVKPKKSLHAFLANSKVYQKFDETFFNRKDLLLFLSFKSSIHKKKRF